MSEWRVRALLPADAGAARALVSAQLSGSTYESRVLEQLEVATGGGDAECRAAVAIAPDEHRVHGVLLFGIVAGARGVVKIHALIAGDAEPARVLAASAKAGCVHAGERMIVCELADEAPWLVMAQAMRELGFAEEGRIADFVCDGVDLLLLVWRSE